MKREHFLIPILVMILTLIILHMNFVKSKRVESQIIPTIHINDCYIYQYKSINPFKTFPADTLHILAIKAGYILYEHNDGFIYSEEIKFFLNSAIKTDTCNCKHN